MGNDPLMKSFHILIVALCALSSSFFACTQNGSVQEEAATAMDTVITEIRDTVITFYPDTYEEVMQVVTSYDTVITPRESDPE